MNFFDFFIAMLHLAFGLALLLIIFAFIPGWPYPVFTRRKKHE